MNSWSKILRVRTQTAICETDVKPVRNARYAPSIHAVDKLREQGAGQPTTAGGCALMEEHLDTPTPPQKSVIVPQIIQQHLNQLVQ